MSIYAKHQNKNFFYALATVAKLNEAAKKRYFLVARPLRPNPPPLELSGHKKNQDFLRASKNGIFS